MAMVFGYTRVSTKDQADSGLGLTAQKEAIERYIAYRFGGDGVAYGNLFVDKAVSGDIPFAEREYGGQLNLTMSRGDHIVVAKLDRAFRRTDDCCLMVEKWNERGIILHALDVNLDTSTDSGQMIIKILAVVAEWERKRIAERTHAARQIAKALGKPLNGHAGYGFMYVGARGHRRRVPDPVERAQMKKIVEWRMQGNSWEGLYFHFLQNGIRRKGGREWSVSRIYRAFLAELKLMAEEAGPNARSGVSPAAAAKPKSVSTPISLPSNIGSSTSSP
jgi:DNA invertase Pin-like site-specific DNA recombinase